MSLKRYLGLVRGALLLSGTVVLCWGVYVGATIPEPPPDTDGVPVGFAVAFVLLDHAGGALLLQSGYALPPGTGRFRFGPLADRPAAVRAAVLTAAFAVAVVLLTVLGWILPDSLPRLVSGTYAFSWLGAAVGTAVGIAVTVVLGAATALVRLALGEPLLGGGD
ncbi:hypothetical protein JCM30237_26930 [Halolamina litorea]|uniref:Tripartite tricarboxylate transporter TctB family protein n=1 Tax=Halolamina litorea TaxID=1515593 RepID=A0ABD6BNW8_9EURY|nr:hypothetical protein [Halolamina litorea]